MTSGATMTVDKMKEIIKAIESLDVGRVLVGVPEDKADARTSEEGGGEINNAYLARIHEYGAPAANIPPRPFLEPGIQDAREQIAQDLEAGMGKVLDGDIGAAQKALDAAGTHAAKRVQEKFTNNNWDPLTPATIARRHKNKSMKKKYRKALADGDLSSVQGDYKPLIDTGALRRAITYVVRKKGE